MKLKDTFHFAYLNLKLRKLRTFFTLLGVIIGIAALVFFVSLTEGVKHTVFNEILKSYSLKQIIVKNDYFNVSFFKVNKSSKLQITDERVSEIADIPGVSAVYPVLTLKVPATIQLSLFNMKFESDVPLFGLSPEIFKDQPALYKRFSQEGDVMPGMLHTKIIDYFNAGFTEPYGFPMIDKSVAVGKAFKLFVGYSIILNSQMGEVEEIDGIGAGFSDRIPVMGLTIPLKWAQKLARTYEDRDGESLVYNLMYVDVESPAHVAGVSKQIEDMGFRTESAIKLTKEVGSVIQNFLMIFGAISLVILIVSAFSIANTISMSVVSRTKEIGIMRSYGATKGDISKLFLAESFIIGSVGGGVGILFGYFVSRVANLYLLTALPEVTFKPSNFFLLPWWLVVCAFLIALLLSLVAGYIPSRQAAKMPPIKALMLH